MMTGKRITKVLMVAVVAMGILGATVGTSQALEFYQPAAAFSTATDAKWLATGIVNGNGLSATPTASNLDTVTHAGAGGGNYWISKTSSAADREILFVMPGGVDVDSVYYWPVYHSSLESKIVTNFNISFSTNFGATYSSPLSLAGFTSVSSSPTSVQTNTFATQSNVTNIKFTDILPVLAGQTAAIGEIRFGGPDGGGDSTAPTLISFADDQSGGPVTEQRPLFYTVTFSEGMDVTTFQSADFTNAGPLEVRIHSFSAIETSRTVRVEVTAFGSGPLQLQVKAGATLNDLAGNPLDTSSAILDDTIITVNGESTTVITPSNATSTQATANYIADNIISGSGLSGGGSSGNVLTETHGSYGGGNWWQSASANASDRLITFELPSASDVNRVHYWRGWYSDARFLDQTVTAFDISFSSDGVNFVATNRIDGFEPGDGVSGPTSVQTMEFPLQTGVTHIKLTDITPMVGGKAPAMAEIRFGYVAAPVLPAGTVIMIR
ncbi:MAG: hypothetical protein HN919_03620 [Verrucomicrobia bacterium]|nr:hypothetical protein [Verrucomicrobiota bacterium]